MATNLDELTGNELLAFLRELTDAYRRILGNDNADSVDVDGVLRPTITRWMTWMVQGGRVFSTQADGLANTSNSEFFSVIQRDSDFLYIRMFQNVDGNAVYFKTIRDPKYDPSLPREYVSVTAALADTVDGDYFYTRTSSGGRTGNFLERYRNDNGTATFLDASNRANIYGSINNGLANTGEGEFFEVVADVAGSPEVYSRIYRNENGEAAYIRSTSITALFSSLASATAYCEEGKFCEVRGSNEGRTGNYMERFQKVDGEMVFVAGTPNKVVFGSVEEAMAETYSNSIFYVIDETGGQLTLSQYHKSASGEEYTLLGVLNPGGSGGTASVLPRGVYSSQTLLAMGVTEGFRNMTGNDSQQPDVDPGIIPSLLQSVSGYIDVKQGECYALTFPEDDTLTTHQNFVQFFNDTTPVGSLVWAVPTLADEGGPLAKVLGVNGNPKRQLTRYFRVPRDGRIRISGPTTGLNRVSLSLVSYEEFIDNQLWRLAALNLKTPEWKDKVYSPVYSRTYLQYNGDGTTTSQANGAISEAVPCSPGQFVTAIVPTDTTGASVVFFNSLGGVVSVIGAHGQISSSWSNNGQLGGILANENIPVPDGAVSVAISIRGHDYPHSDAGLILVTDEFEQWERDWAVPGKKLERWEGYKANNISPINVEQNAEYDSFPQIAIQPGTIVKLTYQLNNVANDAVMARAYNLDPEAIAAAQASRTLLVTGMETQATPVTGKTYTIYYYADTVPSVIWMNTKAGFGSAEVLTYEQFVADRNEVLAGLVMSEKVTGGSGNPYGIYGEGYTPNVGSVGYIPMLPYEVINFKTNLTEVFGFTGEFRVEYGNYEARFLRVPRLFLGNVTAKNDFKRTIQNNDRFAWMYFQLESTTPDSYFGDDVPTVMSKEEFEARYLDTGEEIDNGYMQDVVARLDWDDGTLIQNVWDTTTFSNDNIRAMAPFSVIKGQCYRWKMAMGHMKQLRGPTIVYLDPSVTGASGYYTPKPLIEMGPTVLPNQISAQPMMGYFKAEEDGWLYLTERRCGDNEDPDSAQGRLYDQFQQLSVELVSEETYLEETTPSSTSRMLYIADPEGLEFHMINGPMPYHRSALLDQEYEYPVQIWQKGVKLGTWTLKTAVQGSGSTTVDNIKVNIDVKLYNADDKRIDIKIGDWQQTNKLTLKANNYDRTANRDAIATRIWREIRRQRPFPDDRILDPRIWDKEPDYSKVKFFHDSVASTQGIPAAVYYGGMYYGMFMLRNKKDEPNYGIIEEDPDFIWLQSDYRWNYEANNEVNFVRWGAWDWKQWEVTQPEEEDYTVGSVPQTQTTVNAVTRVLQWIDDMIGAGSPTAFAQNADTYLYVPSWIDYYVLLEVLNAQDNNDNNIQLTCYNATAEDARWTIHAYDFDSTMGWLGNPVEGHIPNNADVFRLMRQGMFDQIAARYRELRQNVLSVKNLMFIVRDEGGKASIRWREDDADLWGDQDYNSVIGIQKWLAARLAYLDDYFAE